MQVLSDIEDDLHPRPPKNLPSPWQPASECPPRVCNASCGHVLSNVDFQNVTATFEKMETLKHIFRLEGPNIAGTTNRTNVKAITWNDVGDF